MRRKNLFQLGLIFFFIGLTLVLISWIQTYPIKIKSLADIMLSQFFPSIWPGIVLCLSGLFTAGFFSKKKTITIACASLMPLIFYSYIYFFQYIPQSDAGTSISMVAIFSQSGIDASVVPYFQFPGFFISNVILKDIINVDLSFSSFIAISLYAVLLGSFVFLIMNKNYLKNNKEKTDFISVPIYFIAMFSFLNFQWAPQTLAFILFLPLIYLIQCNISKVKKNILIIVLFVFLTFTHPIISGIFLLIFGVILFKKRYYLNLFIILLSFYFIFYTYYATFWLPYLITALQQSLYSFGLVSEYSTIISFQQPEGFVNEFISMLNRIRVPAVMILLAFGTLIKFIKKELNPLMIAIGIGSGAYLMVGTIFSILGLRAIQIFFISLLTGTEFYVKRFKKITPILILIFLILSVAGPMRMVYDETQFLSDQETQTCDFLILNNDDFKYTKIGANQVDWGYFTQKYQHMHKVDADAYRPGNEEFYDIFNTNMQTNSFVIYNGNLAKEIVKYNFIENEVEYYINKIVSNKNIIYNCSNTIIINGYEV